MEVGRTAKRIDIKGQIVESSNARFLDWLGIENTSPHRIIKELQGANGDDIEVYINSPGGSIFAGSEIYTELRAYKGKVNIKITGIAASAASVIAEAGESEISPTGMYMIHNVQTSAEGDYRNMDAKASALRAANQSIINAYMDKTKMDGGVLQKLMDKETYLSAQQAVEYGFVDKIMFTENAFQMQNSFGCIPENTLIKLRNALNYPDQDDTDGLIKKNKAKARLKILNLKGEKKHD